jgi:UDP-N-acetyl-D-galactosamine dehydrogenase
MKVNKSKTKICVVGLGYVGLPLVVCFGRVFDNVTGFDINEKRVKELSKGKDSNKEQSEEELNSAKILFTNDASKIKESNFIIIAVPTPITEDQKPDLSYVKSASEIVGKNMSKGSIVVFESTVYPGVTEDICLPILEKESGLKGGVDFKIGYSPERINPGDKLHTIDKIIKIVSGMDEESLNHIAEIYSKVITAGVYKAENIKVAEAAKLLENTQRDLNIALMNEWSVILSKFDVSTKSVIEAASTKWNFHKYYPGLVGGHCIGIDPYYLVYRSKELGYDSQIILAARRMNESMAFRIKNKIMELLNSCDKNPKESNVLIMGLTFKENVADIRNNKVIDLINSLKSEGVYVTGCDPMVSPEEIEKEFNIKNVAFSDVKKVDGIVILVNHELFKSISLKDLASKMDTPILIDTKSFYNKKECQDMGFKYFAL